MVDCPCCSASLVVDPETGAVISHEAPARPQTTFEDAFKAEKSRHARTEQRFGQAFKQEKHRKDTLDQKFQEAQKKAEKSDKPVRNPLDYD